MFFARPNPSRRPAPSGPPPRLQTASPAELDAPPQADPAGTWLILLGSLLTGLLMDGARASDVACFAAVGVGLSLVGSALFDLRRGMRNLVRADLMALLAFYFLTLFEFLFRQPHFNTLVDPAATKPAVIVCLWAFAGLAVGRHLVWSRCQPLQALLTRPMSQGWLLFLYWACFFTGFLHIFVAVEWDVMVMLEAMVEPRFAQPWGRGKFGDWKALFVELSMLLYLVPALAGILFARRRSYAFAHLVLVGAGFLFTLFYAFSSGTRNIFDSYLVTFLIGYAFASKPHQQRELIGVGAISAVLLIASTILMLEFRQIGLKNYLRGERRMTQAGQQWLSVDVNLYAISQLTSTFPAHHEFLGWEVPYLAIIRPIPRALWKNKPEGMSASIEEAVGANAGWTVAASFAGEAYMAGGLLAVVGSALLFGAFAGWWSRLASSQNSELGILIYASGFFAAVISMRSVYAFTTALLPTLAVIGIGTFVMRQIARQTQRLLRRPVRMAATPAPRPVRRG